MIVGLCGSRAVNNRPYNALIWYIVGNAFMHSANEIVDVLQTERINPFPTMWMVAVVATSLCILYINFYPF